MEEVILDTIIDTIKLIPFLFLTYLIMEYIEHKTSGKINNIVKESGKFGPLIGGLLGTIPQCGFSVAATSLYSTRLITLGTLISVYLATSDEMIPIMISEGMPITSIIKVLLIKVVIAIIAGFIIDVVIKNINYKAKKHADSKIVNHKNNSDDKISSKAINYNKNDNVKTDDAKIKHKDNENIETMCKHEHCHCDEDGIFKSALKHTLNILGYILVITFVINIIVYFIGEQNIANFVKANPLLAPAFASIIGLIPNCASSVILTQLYVEKVIPVSTMIAGLLVSAGVGLAVLFKTNKSIKENIKILLILFVIGTLSGTVLQLIGINF